MLLIKDQRSVIIDLINLLCTWEEKTYTHKFKG